MCYISVVKLTAKVRLYPSDEQEGLLFATLREANAACNEIAQHAWENKVFRQYDLHHAKYHAVKASFDLSAQMVVRCIAKVSDAYKLDRKRQRTFRELGSIAYDSRILSWKTDKVSIWCVGGRQKIPYRTGGSYLELLKYQQGETDLAYIKGKWYLLTTCDVPSEEEESFNDVIGVDLGITNIASDSDGNTYSGRELNALRKQREKVRASLQSKGTKSAKKVLKRISGRERTTTKIINHTIAKNLVAKAKREGKAISIESLKGIRQSTNKRLRKSQKGLHNRWSFHDLKLKIEYKAERAGVTVITVPAAYTSKTCSYCKHIGKRSGESFNCTNCGHSDHADVNGAKNIRGWGRIIDRPESSTLFCDISTFVRHVRQG